MGQTIAVMTSGGDSSGMNPAIRGVVRGALSRNMKVLGIFRGYEGLIDGDIRELSSRDVGGIIDRGGTILQTARSKRFREKKYQLQAVQQLKDREIGGLVVIGGNGSLTGLKALTENSGIAGIGLPGTIDNDLYGTDFTIGFDTAINAAMEVIDRLRDTATSHERLFLVEVMGRHSGYIAACVALAGGAEDVLIPETTTNLDGLCAELIAGKNRGKKSSIVVVAEGDEEGGAIEIGKKIRGRTGWDVRVSVIGHMQRGGSPTALERINAGRMGVAAAQALADDRRDVMVGIIHDEITYTPLEKAVSEKKVVRADYLEAVQILSL